VKTKAGRREMRRPVFSFEGGDQDLGAAANLSRQLRFYALIIFTLI
jgi:hypothetical protein